MAGLAMLAGPCAACEICAGAEGKTLPLSGTADFLHLRLLYERGENGGGGRTSLLVLGGKGRLLQLILNREERKDKGQNLWNQNC